MTITVTDSVKNAIQDAKETNFPLLITIQEANGNVVRLTNAPEDVTYANEYYSSDSFPINNVSLSNSGASVERERFGITFVDSARTIHPYFNNNKTAKISVGILVIAPEGEHVGVIPITSGILSRATHSVTTDPSTGSAQALTTIEVIGLFPKLDYSSFLRTTKESQNRLGRFDNIFDYVNVPLDQVWGSDDDN